LAGLYPDGPRHDLALDELLWAAAMIAGRQNTQHLLLTYALLRLTLHWLRLERHMLDLVLSSLLLLARFTWPDLVRKLPRPRK
jgi:hypothetical protein